MNAVVGAVAAPVQVYVLPGEVKVTALPTRFLTILGSCVALCLYDLERGVGGINHFLLPGAPEAGEDAPLRWAAPSIDVLFSQLAAAGARLHCLQAKVFGGASIGLQPVHARYRVGERNVESALAELAARGVAVSSHHTGGKVGRKVIFEVHTGVVWMKELARAF